MSATEHQIALLHDRSALVASLAAAACKEQITVDQYGAVFTRRWVVDLILDLVGYTASAYPVGSIRAV